MGSLAGIRPLWAQELLIYGVDLAWRAVRIAGVFSLALPFAGRIGHAEKSKGAFKHNKSADSGGKGTRIGSLLHSMAAKHPNREWSAIGGRLPGGIGANDNEKALAIKDHQRVVDAIEAFFEQVGLDVPDPVVITTPERVYPGGRIRYGHSVYGKNGEKVHVKSVQHHSGVVLELSWQKDLSAPKKIAILNKAPRPNVRHIPRPLLESFLLDQYADAPWFSGSEVEFDTELPLAGAVFAQAGEGKGAMEAHKDVRMLLLAGYGSNDLAEAFLITLPGGMNAQGGFEWRHRVESPDGDRNTIDTEYDGVSGRLRSLTTNGLRKVYFSGKEEGNEMIAEQYFRLVRKKAVGNAYVPSRIVELKNGLVRSVIVFEKAGQRGDQYALEWMHKQIVRQVQDGDSRQNVVIVSVPDRQSSKDDAGYVHEIHLPNDVRRYFQSGHSSDPTNWRLLEVSANPNQGRTKTLRRFELAPEEIADPLSAVTFAGEPWFHALKRQDASTPEVSGQILFRSEKEATAVQAAHDRAIKGLPSDGVRRMLVTRPLEDSGSAEPRYEHILIESGHRKTWVTTAGPT